MLLAVDVGNSNTTLGLFDQNQALLFRASIHTDSNKTADQISIDLINVFHLYGQRIEDVSGSILCSVVPPVNFMMEKALKRIIGVAPMVLGPGIKTGLNLRLENQSLVGGDLVAGAVGAMGKFQAPVVVIDMGTATTFSVISKGHVYQGGLLLPGVNVSLEALSEQAAQLPRISLQKPKMLIGKNTQDCMCSGIVYGTAGMIDGILDRIQAEYPKEPISVVATGAHAPVIVGYCRHKIVYDKNLLLEGLLAIYQKNKG